MKILIAEDDAAFRHLLQKLLSEWGYQVVAAQDGSEACQILLSEAAPKLAILDWKMPGMAGTQICRKVRAEHREPYIYIILLTAQRRDEDLVFGMEAGADDYILKPFKLQELRVRLRSGRRLIELQDELLAARAMLQAKASHDSLTGLVNREEILSMLDTVLAKSERDGGCVSAVMVDIDHFKKINDTFGHLTGDVVLRITAQKMHALMRPSDSIGRYGGEEFLIILAECCDACAVTFAQRVCASIGGDLQDTPEGMIPVTISLGIASSCGNKRLDAHSLLKAADAALYKAKERGRNRVEVASGGLVGAE